MNIVCVFAHQDDETRCLGTLLRLREAGNQIAFVCVTQGDKGLPFSDPEARRTAGDVRRKEMEAVAAAFDARYICLEREDGFVTDDNSLRRDLIECLRSLRAEVVFTHWVNDYNSDHVIAAKATIDAALFTNLGSFESVASPLTSVPRIFHTHPGDGYGFEATHFVELGKDHVARKLEIIRLHDSQLRVSRRLFGRDYAEEIGVEDSRQGIRLMVSAAEAFRPCVADRRIPWPSDLPPRLVGASEAP